MIRFRTCFEGSDHSLHVGIRKEKKIALGFVIWLIGVLFTGMEGTKSWMEKFWG